MANVFSFNNVKMKDADFCVDMFNTILNEQKELAMKTMFAYEKLKKENPGKFDGKDFLLKDYIDNIRKIDNEFKKFINVLEKYQGVRFRVKKEKSTADIKMEVDNEEVEVVPEMVEIRVSSKEGFNASHEGNHFMVLNTTLTEELIHEGIVREFISKVQNLRKTKDFEITDRITIYYSENNDFENAISNYIEVIKEETLAVELIKKDLDVELSNLNGLDVKFDVEKN